MPGMGDHTVISYEPSNPVFVAAIGALVLDSKAVLRCAAALMSGCTRHSGPWQFHPGPGFKQFPAQRDALWTGPESGACAVELFIELQCSRAARWIENWTNDRGHYSLFRPRVIGGNRAFLGSELRLRNLVEVCGFSISRDKFL